MTIPSKPSTKAIAAILAIVVLLVSAVAPAVALYDPATGNVDPIANPDYPQTCGVNAVFLIDRTASMSESNLTDVKAAVKSAVDVYNETGATSRVGVISFRQVTLPDEQGAHTRIGITPLDSSANVTAVKAAIDSTELPAPELEGTNWEAAFLEASLRENDNDNDVVGENANKPADVVIILSDGRPNTYGYPTYNGTGNANALEAATLAANVVKGEGTRIIGIGFPGSDGTPPIASAFEAVTDGGSSVTGSADPQENDYLIVDSSTELTAVLTGIAQDTSCGLSVEKLNDADGNGVFTDDETADMPGDNVTYQVNVTNTGTIDLTIDGYGDSIYGNPSVTPALADQPLPVGSSVVVTFEGFAPPENGVKTNVFNVTASDGNGFVLTAEDDTTVRSPDVIPSISVEKLNDADGNGVFTDDETTDMPGDAVTYLVTVTNDGENTVTIDSFSDDVYTSLNDGDFNQTLTGVALAPGESISVTFNGSSPASEDAAKVNTFNVSAVDDDGDVASAEDDTTVRSPNIIPEISVEKLNDADGDGTFSDDETASPGANVTYQVAVTNVGNNSVNITSFSDDIYTSLGGSDLNQSLVGVVLAPGESISVTFNGSAPLAEGESKTNTFNVSASDDDGDVASAEDDTTVRSPDVTPHISVDKQVDANGDGTFSDSEEASDVGTNVTYRVVVTNTGNNSVNISGFSDSVYASLGDSDLNQSLVGAVLAPGEWVAVTFNESAPSDYSATVHDVFTVVAHDGDGDEASDSDDATLTTPEPVLNICPRTPGFWVTHNGQFATGENQNFTTELLPVRLGDGSEKSVNVMNDTIANKVFNAELTDDSHKSNGVSKLYIHLLAAKLNAANGAVVPGDVQAAMDRSDELLAQYNESDWNSIRKDADGREILDLKDTLDSYNNGYYTDQCVEDGWTQEVTASS